MTEQLPTLGPRRKRLFVLLTMGLVAATTILVAEILVRVFLRYNTPDTVRVNSLQYASAIFARSTLKPRQYVELDKAWGDQSQADSTDRIYVINEHGYRGRPISLQKSEETCRLVVIGGSAVFDVSAKEGRDWPHLIEDSLQGKGFENVEVINAGVPGHASFDSLGRLYSQIWMLEPDYALLYNAWNDVKYFRSLSREEPLISLIKPYDERADPFRNYQGSLDRALSNLQLYVKLRNRYFLQGISLGPEGSVPQEDLVSTYDRLAIRQYQLNVELFVDASRNIGADPVLLTQASLVSAEASPEDRRRIAYRYQGLTHDALARALGECNEVVRKVARSKQAKLIDLAAMFTGRSNLFYDHVHTTERGSEMLAKAVAEFMAERLYEGCGASEE